MDNYMKYLFLILFPCFCFANQYNFTYNMPDHGTIKSLNFKIKAKNFDEALNKGADFCYKFFINREPLTNKRKMDIIDTCANPSQN